MIVYLFSYLSIIVAYFIQKNIRSLYLYLIIIYLILFIGLRDHIGADWHNYLYMYQKINNSLEYQSLYNTLFSITDFSYAFLNIISGQLSLSVHFVNLICAAIFVIGSWKLCKFTKLPIFSLTIIMPYIGFAVAMGYTRQSAAIGLIFFGIGHLIQNDLKRFAIYILIATSFHFSAIITILFLLNSLSKKTLKKFIIYFIFFTPIVYFIMIRIIYSADSIITNYTSGNLNSQGAFIRLMMNSIVSIIFLLYYFGSNQFREFNKEFNRLFLLLSIASITLFLFQFNFSTIADRFGLYFCCIQPLVLTQIARFYRNIRKTIFIITVSIIYLTTLVVWLEFSFYAQNFWLPYNNILFLL